jgi:hypothetical protein
MVGGGEELVRQGPGMRSRGGLEGGAAAASGLRERRRWVEQESSRDSGGGSDGALRLKLGLNLKNENKTIRFHITLGL